jgi:hypothetical protein
MRWCKTRGRGTAGTKGRRVRRQTHYRLAQRDGAVFLVKRGSVETLMPGMWELPEMHVDGIRPDVRWTLRHSITITDFTIEVSVGEPPQGIRGRWVRREQAEALPLTGLAKKILRRASFI